jgi:uncharacterized protein
MSSADYRHALADYIRANALPVEKFSHQPRLYALAHGLGEGMSFDDDVLYAAAWLHDLGVFVGHRPEDPVALAAWDHLVYTMRRTPELLRQFGFPEAKIDAVVEAIRTHQPSASPVSVEGTLLRDADILEQLGAVGILRSVCKIGRDTRYATFADVIALLRRSFRELPGQIRLPKARQQAEARLRVMEAFLDGAEAEGGEWL